MLEATNTQPFSSNDKYRMPDRPYSLFEGLAGTICAWAEAIALIDLRLGKFDDRNVQEKLTKQPDKENLERVLLGIPGLGGYGAQGYL